MTNKSEDKGSVVISADGDTRPTVKDVLVSTLIRGVVPALLMFGFLMLVGHLIMTTFHQIPSEEAVSRDAATWRDPTLNDVTKYVSTANDTWYTIGGSIVIGLVILALTRKWWLGVLPVLAISLEASVFVPVTQLIGRPRPQVAKLDQSPPTSSFPSGHTAASFALFWSLMLLASRVRSNAVRVTIQVFCFLFPFCVGTARLYRGMHHLSDILFGMLLGVVSALCAYASIRAAERKAARRGHCA